MVVPVLMGWLMQGPRWMWGKEPSFERAKKSRAWFDASSEPDPVRIAAELIVGEMERLGWTMCQPVTSSSQTMLQPPCCGCGEACDAQVEGSSQAHGADQPGVEGRIHHRPGPHGRRRR
ncbi:MAG TPA: hypothetical protein VF628_10985 [Allosphingosinicella sp.]|jgi:hypothetical protein